jgi:hypothetical protein
VGGDRRRKIHVMHESHGNNAENRFLFPLLLIVSVPGLYSTCKVISQNGAQIRCKRCGFWHHVSETLQAVTDTMQYVPRLNLRTHRCNESWNLLSYVTLFLKVKSKASKFELV